MCRFASFVLTKDKELYLDDSDSHSNIIREYNLHEWGVNGPNVVKVEILPSRDMTVWPSLKQWKFVIDQDVLPVWADKGELEKRTRAALQERYKKGFRRVDVSGCTSLKSLKADAARRVYVRGCTKLESLKADAATDVDVSGCTKLVYEAKKGQAVYR